MHRSSAALRGAPPIVCFGNDWDGDPTSKHHIMRLYAKHTPVLWVESSGMRPPALVAIGPIVELEGALGWLGVADGGAGLDRRRAG